MSCELASGNQLPDQQAGLEIQQPKLQLSVRVPLDDLSPIGIGRRGGAGFLSRVGPRVPVGLRDGGWVLLGVGLRVAVGSRGGCGKGRCGVREGDMVVELLVDGKVSAGVGGETCVGF